MYRSASEDTDQRIAYYGLDLSLGMLQKHPAYGQGTLFQGDAQVLPFPDHRFDVVMANHMLYHVPDIDATITEFRRVLKPGGVVMVATNSQQSMPELQVLMRRAIILLTRASGAQVQAPMPASDLFALENGARHLARYFYAVMRNDLPSVLLFQEIEPVMAYLESTRAMREPQLPPDVAWDDVMAIMRQQVTHLINHLNELPINKQAGVLVATDNGDFIREFVEHRARATSAATE
jgi:SAM-dependent methyltransferase